MNMQAKIYEEFGQECGGWTPVMFARGVTEKCNNAAEALAKSLLIMSACDIVYFGKKWNFARGCKVEYQVCEKYGTPIVEYKEEEN